MLVRHRPHHATSNPSMPRQARRRRWAPILAILAMALSVLFLTPPQADANLGFGGGGGFCPAEFHSCSPNGSWCTWYGWCGAGGGVFEGGGGGGGGGTSPVDYYCPGHSQTIRIVDGWGVIDYGTCPTQAICRAKRNVINIVLEGAPGEGRAYCWANWNIPNSNGRHLVFATPLNGVNDGGLTVGPRVDPELVTDW